MVMIGFILLTENFNEDSYNTVLKLQRTVNKPTVNKRGGLWHFLPKSNIDQTKWSNVLSRKTVFIKDGVTEG